MASQNPGSCSGKRLRFPGLPSSDREEADGPRGGGKGKAQVADDEQSAWAGMPWDALSLIFVKAGPAWILCSLQAVCRHWRRLACDPRVWRVVDFVGTDWVWLQLRCRLPVYLLEMLAPSAVNRSAGGLEELSIYSFARNGLLMRLPERAPGLRCLRLISCCQITEDVLPRVLKQLPLLVELEISLVCISDSALEAVGQACPSLRCLRHMSFHDYYNNCNDGAFAIAKSMPNLKELQISGNQLTNEGLVAILDGCPLLESLDLRLCYNINFNNSLEWKCERIKDLRLPTDSMAGHPYLFDVIGGYAGRNRDDRYKFQGFSHSVFPVKL